MGKFIRLGLGLMAGVAAGLALYGYIKRRQEMHEGGPPFAESAEYGGD
jgi:hypothetical protein